MKIEKLNDNQIRCTLTRDDLAAHQLKLSELAYGSEKAKSLFHDMMVRASQEVGFEANDIPLMIEAMPGAADSIVLTITKVENPDELDAKFSKFGSAFSGDSDRRSSVMDRLKKLEGASDVLELLRQVTETVGAPPEVSPDKTTKKEEIPAEHAEEEIPLRFLSFSTLDGAIKAAELLNGIYKGSNTLYKDDFADLYVWALTQSEHTTSDFNRICNMLSEYGCAEPGDGATLAFLEEHCTVIASQNAAEILASL